MTTFPGHVVPPIESPLDSGARLAGASLHCWFLFVVLAVAVITGWGRKYEGPNGEPVKALPAQTK